MKGCSSDNLGRQTIEIFGLFLFQRWWLVPLTDMFLEKITVMSRGDEVD